MEQNEKEFERIVRQHKSTIYTMCCMFSKDEDEVNGRFFRIKASLAVLLCVEICPLR